MPTHKPPHPKPGPPPATPTANISATSTTIVEGDSTTLNWTTTNATTGTINGSDPFNGVSVLPSGSTSVSPTTTTTYTLSVNSGAATSSVTVTVNPVTSGNITAQGTHVNAEAGTTVSGPSTLPATFTSDFYNSQLYISATSDAGPGPITIEPTATLPTGIRQQAAGSASTYLAWVGTGDGQPTGGGTDTPTAGTYPITLRFSDTYGNVEDKVVTVVVRRWFTKDTRVFVSPIQQGHGWLYVSYGAVKLAVAGTVTLELYVANQSGTTFSASPLTVQWYKDGAAWGSPQAGTSTKSWDTTLEENRAYVIEARIIGVTGGQMHKYRALPGIFTVGNGTPKAGSYTVGVTQVCTAGAAAQIFDTQASTSDESVKPSYITFPGSRTRRTDDYPFTHSSPSPPANDTERNALISPSAWVIVPWLGLRSNWGFTAPSWFEDSNGTVFVGQHFPRVGVESAASNSVSQKFPSWCGYRGDNTIDQYVTFAYIPGGTSGVLALELDGRLAHIRANGSMRTVLGYAITPASTTVPKDPRGADSHATIRAHQETLQGTFSGAEFSLPNDIRFDPDWPSTLKVYITDTENQRIAVVEFTNTNFDGAVCSTYKDLTGYDADAEPYSLDIDTDGTIYVADRDLGQVYKIAPSAGSVTKVCDLTHAQVIRMNSLGQLIVATPPTSNVNDATGWGKIWRVNKSTGATTQLIATRYMDQTFITPPTWVWIAVDKLGNVGPIDTIYLGSSLPNSDPNVSGIDGARSSILAVYVDGSGDMTSAASWMHACNGSPFMIGRPSDTTIYDPFGHYPWAIDINPAKAEFITTGYGGLGVLMWRKRVSGDPDSHDADVSAFNRGLQLMLRGTVPSWPLDSRSSFTAIHGRCLENYMGPAARRGDDFNALNDTDLNAAIQAGLDTNEARPEITGNDLRDLRYYIRRCSMAGVLTDDVRPDANDADTTPPGISSVSATGGSGEFTVTWTTSESAIGFVEFGPDDYYGLFRIESSFGTSHSLNPTGLLSGTYHYRVVAKDVAGNVTRDSDRTVVVS